MKKTSFSILFTFLFIGIASAQEINQTNKNGERVGLWKKYYNNQRIRYEGQFENGKEVGVFKFYSAASSDFPVVIKTYNSNNYETEVQFFTEKGVLESEGKMVEKERIGKWLYYHTDGKTVMIEEHYVNNQLSGDYKIFYSNGKLTKFAHYKNDLLNGNSKKHSQEGVLIEDLNYIDNVLNGPAAFYETNGNVKQKGTYKDDLKVGVWEFFIDGVLSSSKEIKVTTLEDD